MKSIVKKSRLLLLSLVWFLIVWFVSIAIWITIINTTPDDEHKVTLHSLYLEGGVTDKLIRVEDNKENLDVNNWLIVGSNHTVEWSAKYSSIGWGQSNTIKWNTVDVIGWGIWWWEYNKVNEGSNSAVGWWSNNTTDWGNSVVVWWKKWESLRGWVILWWWGTQQHAFDVGVVLWGNGNKAGNYSLVLWENVNWWNTGSFVWNGKARQQYYSKAGINAKSWVLIWTYNPVDGVSLVVSGSMKLDDGTDDEWVIRLNSSWCLTMYDGHTHVLGRSSKSVCNVASWCQFGSVFLQDWDVVTGYRVSYSTNCNGEVTSVQCNNWNLSQQVYPYCYKISDKPRRNDW